LLGRLLCDAEVRAFVCWLQDCWQVLAGVHLGWQGCGDEVHVALGPLEEHQQVCGADMVADQHVALQGV
jgi:hypothetical protein